MLHRAGCMDAVSFSLKQGNSFKEKKSKLKKEIFCFNLPSLLGGSMGTRFMFYSFKKALSLKYLLQLLCCLVLFCV